MTIDLTSPEQRPSITQARITALAIDLGRRICEIQVTLGYMLNGQFIVARVQPVIIRDDADANDFTAMVQAVPEFRNLRQALENYLNTSGYFTGVVS